MAQGNKHTTRENFATPPFCNSENIRVRCSSCSKYILFTDMILAPQKKEKDIGYSLYYLKYKCQKAKLTLYQQTEKLKKKKKEARFAKYEGLSQQFQTCGWKGKWKLHWQNWCSLYTEMFEFFSSPLHVPISAELYSNLTVIDHIMGFFFPLDSFKIYTSWWLRC